MFRVKVKCPHKDCQKSLMDSDVLVSNRESIHLVVSKDGVNGDIYLSSIYGDYNCIDPEVPHFLNGDTLNFLCPHCAKPLPTVETCSCGAKTVVIELVSGGQVKFCSRKGCHYHNLSFQNSEDLYRFLDKE